MLQQTRVATAVDYFNRFIQKFRDISTLAAAEPEQVLKAWEGLGYYSRARHLHQAAIRLAEADFPRVPDDPEEFIKLPGVGPYINAAVQSIAFGHPLAVVDGNVKRVLARLLLEATPVNQPAAHKVYADLADRLLEKKDSGTYNQALMELGALVCLPRLPDCGNCPVRAHCRALAADRCREFPRRNAAARTPRYHQVAGVIARKGKLLLVRRPSRGLLGGLWEFPNARVEPGQTAEAACQEAMGRQVGLPVTVANHLGRIHHAYTHFQIDLDAYWCRSRSGRVRLAGPAAFRWVRPEEFSRFPLPKAMHKLLPALRQFVQKKT